MFDSSDLKAICVMAEAFVGLFDGEWVDVTVGRKLACCDCGLVHDVEFQIIVATNGQEHILRRVIGDRVATANNRRSMKARKEGIFAKKKR